MDIAPIKLLAPCKSYLWGGTRLGAEFGKQSEHEIIAESWELSCHPDGPSVIACGPMQGQTLADYLHEAGPGVLGDRAARFGRFPVLIKLIDAQKNLSLQVHPPDAYAGAPEHGGDWGKTEMWYVIDCAEGATLLYGLKEPQTRDTLRQKIQEGVLPDAARRVPVHKGDVFFIPAGTLHAIDAGILIAEIQQNSNLTYRVYDYGRTGPDGKPRALHIDQALDVMTLTPLSIEPGPAGPRCNKGGYAETLLARCEYFTVCLREIETHAAAQADAESFHALLCIEGQGELLTEKGSLPFKKGDTLFLPAGLGEYTIEGRCTMLVTTV